MRLALGQSLIQRHLGQLLSLLSAESSSPALSSPDSLGPCLEFLLKNGILATLVKLAAKDDPPGARAEVIRWYGRAIVELDESFLVHSAVSKPLCVLFSPERVSGANCEGVAG